MFKKLILLATLFASLTLSPAALAEWIKETKSGDGDHYYLNSEGIKKHLGHVYYWVLIDYLVPKQTGDLSSTHLYEADCTKTFKIKKLTSVHYPLPMGRGSYRKKETYETTKWAVPNPKTIDFLLGKKACEE